jgi:hypothetical protein
MAQQGGFELGARAGYAAPLGTTMHSNADQAFTETTSGAVPLILDVGYRVVPVFALGAYAQYSVTFLSGDAQTSCQTFEADCSISHVRAGLQANYIASLSAADAWFGVTLGLERFAIHVASADVAGGDTNGILMTLPDLGIQGGVGFVVVPGFTVGPYASLSMGRFSYGSVESEETTRHVHVPSEDRRFHGWLTVGVRASFAP